MLNSLSVKKKYKGERTIMKYFKKRILLYGTLWMCMGLCGCGIQEVLSAQEKTEENGEYMEKPELFLAEQNYLTWLGSRKNETMKGDFFYEEPTEAGKDYRLYFKQKANSNSSKIQYTVADMTYQLPDLIEGNESYGTPVEIYYSESAEFTGDEQSDFLFAAVYEIEGGKQHICTRVYVGNNTGYEIDSQMSSYLDQKYDELEKKDYPLLDDMLDEIRELYEVYNKKYCLHLNETETLAWKSACMEVINHMEEYLADPYEIRAFSNNYADKWVYISVIDFGHDEIPELVVGDGCSAAVFTYENSELHKIADLYQEGSVNAIYEKNETLLLVDSRGGTNAQNGYVAFCFSETDGEYKTGIYDGYTPNEITINGEGATLEEFNRVFGFEEMEQNALEEIPYVHLIRTEEPCRIQLKNGENVYLDDTFDFNKILYHKLAYN